MNKEITIKDLVKTLQEERSSLPSKWQMHLQTMDDPPQIPGGYSQNNPMNDVILGPGVQIEIPTAIKFTPEQAKIIKDVLDGITPVEDIKKIRGIRVIRAL